MRLRSLVCSTGMDDVSFGSRGGGMTEVMTVSMLDQLLRSWGSELKIHSSLLLTSLRRRPCVYIWPAWMGGWGGDEALTLGACFFLMDGIF